MLQELDAPDPAGCGVGAWFDVPRWELFGKCAYERPVSGTSEGYGFSGRAAEGGELFWGEDVGDEDEAVSVEVLEIVCFGHGESCCEVDFVCLGCCSSWRCRCLDCL